MQAASIGKTAVLMLAALVLAGAGVRMAYAAQPVLVELFTSEGCSSCPPADALLRRLVTTQPVSGVHIIALEEHVDYWNGPGWRDPFSAAEFTCRQRRYATALPKGGVYTPQMVVDGRTAFVGSNSRRARAAISAAGKRALATISLQATYKPQGGLKLHIAMHDLPSDVRDRATELWLAVTENRLSSRVTGGENGGRHLRHDAVVRRLERLDRISTSKVNGYTATRTITLRSGLRLKKLHAVVFLQGTASRRILGVAGVGNLEREPAKVRASESRKNRNPIDVENSDSKERGMK